MNGARLMRFWIFVTVAVSGAVVMAMELLGARLLTVVFGGSIAVWAGVISVTLLSLAAGYAAGGMLADRHPSAVPFYAILLLASVLAALCPYASKLLVPCYSILGLKWGALAGAAVVLAIPLALLGMVGPFAVRLVGQAKSGIGTAAGMVFAVSTLGSVAGTLVTGFWLIGECGVSTSFRVVGLVGCSASVVGLVAAGRGRYLACLILLPALLLLQRSSRIGSHYTAPDGEAVTVNAVVESPYGRIAVMTKGRYRLMVTGGTIQTGVPLNLEDLPRGAMLANRYYHELIPYLVPDAARSRAILIGLGGGMTATVLRKHGMDVDCVEIDGAVVEAARRWFNFKGRAVVADGRVFLQTCERRYDVCVLDAYAGDTLPFQLMSVEAFRTARNVLQPGGMLVVNLVAAPRGKAFSAVLRTVKEVFGETLAIRSEDGDDVQPVTLIASDRKVEVDGRWLDDTGGTAAGDSVGHTLHRLILTNAVDTGTAVLTDDRNAMDLLRADDAIRWRERMARTVGLDTVL